MLLLTVHRGPVPGPGDAWQSANGSLGPRRVGSQRRRRHGVKRLGRRGSCTTAAAADNTRRKHAAEKLEPQSFSIQSPV